jgi:UDP-N-acetylmuramoyl-L-alanyl-D-glutamate--2,6-diaminopimelate ligase
METSLNSAARRKFISISDRKEAIKTAVSMAKPFDILLVAGKGHEKYQEINGVKHVFDDKAVLLEMFELLQK